jgi:hypothetical protein
VFAVYVISGIAETNRHPFDVVEGESEIVAGHMIEYSGMSFAMFYLSEYANMILIPRLDSRLDLAGRQDFCRRHDIHMGACVVPALSLRSDHASRLEGIHSADAGLFVDRCCMDANAVQHLEAMVISGGELRDTLRIKG